MVRFRHIALGGIALVGAGILTLCGELDAFAADNISLSIDTTNISLDIIPRTAEGDFVESSNANISVSTTSTSGYTLSIASSTGSTELTNITDNTSKITSISNNLTNADFSSSSNTQYNNQWGYKPSQYVTMDGETPVTHANAGANAVFKPLPGQAGEILAVTDQANQTNTPDNYTISIGARANNETAIGSYQSDSFVIMAVSNKGVVECDDTKLCVQFNSNGLVFPETNAQRERNVNNVNYDSVATQAQVTKYSHTPNISDDGTYSGSTYTSNMDTTDTVTIDGATSINVTIYYDTESTSYDWVSVYQNPFDISNTNDATVSNTTGNLSGKLAGRNTNRTTDYTTWYTQTYTVTGDTVKFHFRSDGTGNYYGYYAVITGTGIIRNRTLTSGEYAIPTGTNALFYGWSSTATTPGGGLPSDVEYADEAALKSNILGDNGQTKVLYAVWQQGQEITFTKDSNVTSIDVLNASGDSVGTITSSGRSLVLAQGNTYTLKPTYITGCIITAITKTAGEGNLTPKLPNAEFTVGAGTATINIASKTLITFDQAFANAGKTKYSGYYKIQDTDSTICSNVDLAGLGVIGEVIDVRDNQVYKIGKLDDGKCWLLDNLALDLTSSTVLNGMNESNTHASNTTLNYLKGTTTRDPSTDPDGQYATAGVSNWTSNNSYSAPLVNLTNKDVIPSDATSQAGQYKIGGYYNYCAASAGSYCYGNGTSYGTSSGNATEDICPKGWRLPTSNTTGEYSALANAIYGSTGSIADATAYANYRSALRLPLSGNFVSGSMGNQNSGGGFWSSTRYESYERNRNMYYLAIGKPNGVYPSDYDYRYYGRSVRCVLGS